jgi:small-conductance mechanosensitive channel
MQYLQRYLQVETWIELYEQATAWLVAKVFKLTLLIDVGVLAAAFILGWLLGVWLKRWLRSVVQHRLASRPRLAEVLRVLLGQMPALAILGMIQVGDVSASALGYTLWLDNVAEALLTAWVAINFATFFITDSFWKRLVVGAVWFAAALHFLHLLGPLMTFLETTDLSFGEVKLSLLGLVEAIILLYALLKLTGWMMSLFENRLASTERLTPSARILIGQIVRIALIAMAILIPLNMVGINLTALAVFTGAIGVGLGFGLQKVVANFISGIILLLDRSIKPGDVIQIGDVYGWITDLNSRFVSIVTRDNMNYLIPNEDLITNQVVNWSYSDRKVRLKVGVGIAYGADPHQAIALCRAAAEKVDRVLDDPSPRCLLRGFGDSSVDLEVRFWIEDPQNGVANVTSEVLLEVWDAFKLAGVEIPFPQRDVNLKVRDEEAALAVRTVERKEG